MPTNGESDFKVRKLRDGVQILAKQMGDLYGLMERLGQYIVKASQAAFTNQAFDGHRWRTRSTPSYMGIVDDLTRGSDVHDNRFKQRPALVVSGNLRRSLRFQSTAKTVKITSTAPYARLMHEGGESSIPVTRAVRQNLATFLRGRPDLRPTLGFIFRRNALTTTVPERPFMGVAESSRPKIEQIAQDWFEEQASRQEAPTDGS